MSRRKAVFISGPITGVDKYWEPFNEAAEALNAAGYIPLDPTWQPQGLTNEQYMRTSLAMIDAADAVLFLPGWRRSKGATLEHDYCDYIGKPYAREIADLREVLSE